MTAASQPGLQPACGLATGDRPAADRPNIVLVMADDQGWGNTADIYPTVLQLLGIEHR